MGFSGGGSGPLVNHTHDPLLALDGGSLATNATSFGLNDLSLLVSDGTNIEELLAGGALTSIRVNAAANAWESYTPSDVGEELVNKGSLHGCTGGSVQTEVPVGIDTRVLTADSTTASGLAWSAPSGATCSDSLTISGQTNTLCKWLELGI